MYNRIGFGSLKFNGVSNNVQEASATLHAITSTSASSNTIKSGATTMHCATRNSVAYLRLRDTSSTLSVIVSLVASSVRARNAGSTISVLAMLATQGIRIQRAIIHTAANTRTTAGSSVLRKGIIHSTTYTTITAPAVNVRLTTAGATIVARTNAIARRIRLQNLSNTISAEASCSSVAVKFGVCHSSISTAVNVSSRTIKSGVVASSIATRTAITVRRICKGTVHQSALGAIAVSSAIIASGSAIMPSVTTVMKADIVPTEYYFFNLPYRQIKAYVKVYFDGPGNMPTIISIDNYLATLNLLEEMCADSNNPLGAISSNELDIGLVNYKNYFSAYNTESPFYGKLVPNLKVEAFLQIKREVAFVDIPLGTFYTGTWKGTSDSYAASVPCYDVLYFILQKNLPSFKARKQASLYSLFEEVFVACGLTSNDYIIDTSLHNVIVPIAWIPKGTAKDALTLLAQAARSFVYVNKQGKVIVRILSLDTSLPLFRLKDQNQVVSVEVPVQYDSTYSRVTINTYSVTESDSKEVATLQSTVPNGTSEYGPLDLSGPVPYIAYSNTDVSSIQVHITDYTAWTTNIKVINPGDAVTQEIKVYAPVLETAYTTATVDDDTAKALIGVKVLPVDNFLIQDGTYALQYANALLQIVSNPEAKVTINVRGNANIKLGDIIVVEDPSDKLPIKSVLVARSTLNYDGGLDGVIEGYIL